MLSFRPEQVLELAGMARFNGLLSKRTISKWPIQRKSGDIQPLLKELSEAGNILGSINIDGEEIKSIGIARKVTGDIAFYISNNLDSLAPLLAGGCGLDKLQDDPKDRLYYALSLARSISMVALRWPGWIHPKASVLIRRGLLKVRDGSKKPPLSTFQTKLNKLIDQFGNLAQGNKDDDHSKREAPPNRNRLEK